MRETLADYEKYGEWWLRVCERIATGTTAREICAENVLYWNIFMSWIFADSERSEQYQRALQTRSAHRLAERERERAEKRAMRIRVRAILVERRLLKPGAK